MLQMIKCSEDPCYAMCSSTVRTYSYFQRDWPCEPNYIKIMEVWTYCQEVDPECPCDPEMLPPEYEEYGIYCVSGP